MSLTIFCGLCIKYISFDRMMTCLWLDGLWLLQPLIVW